MEKDSKFGLPKSSAILISLVAGIVIGIGLLQLAAKSNLPFSKYLPQVQTQPKPISDQTIVKEENAVIDVVEKVSPSVVAIAANQRVFDPFDPFSLPRNQNNTIGTGFVVDDKGIIVTNKHVVSDTGLRYTVITKDGKKYEAKKIYRDPTVDLAVIQIDGGTGLKRLDLGDSSKLKIGQTTVAIGNALGRFTNTVTTGIVSGLGRRVVAGDPFSGNAESLDDLIQTDAAINPGNSGGPLLNSSGQVIGVNVATTEGAQNIGFAIPINSVKGIVNDFSTKGTVSRPFLGVNYRFISKDLAILNDIPQGAYVQAVITGSAAEKAGVQVGDIITKIDNQQIDSDRKISDIISTKKIGDTLSLTLWSDGSERRVSAALQELPNQ